MISACTVLDFVFDLFLFLFFSSLFFLVPGLSQQPAVSAFNLGRLCDGPLADMVCCAALWFLI